MLSIDYFFSFKVYVTLSPELARSVRVFVIGEELRMISLIDVMHVLG